MKVAVILNEHAGSGLKAGSLQEVFEKNDIESEIHQVDGKKLTDKARELAKAEVDIIAVAGGDGTISTVAGILAGTNKSMAVIPGGTFNHFAKDLNIPVDIAEAVKVIRESDAKPIDIAEVNSKVFINNSSVGLYPKAVRQRKKYFHQLGGSKILAMIISSLSIFNRFPLFKVFLKAEKEKLARTTPFVFIGNNEYMLDLFNLGVRKALDQGKLCLYTANCKKRWSILRFVFLALFNRIHQEEDFDLKLVQELRLETGKRRVRVALDGEVIQLKPPLHFKIRPGDLKVIFPNEPKDRKERLI